MVQDSDIVTMEDCQKNISDLSNDTNTTDPE